MGFSHSLPPHSDLSRRRPSSFIRSSAEFSKKQFQTTRAPPSEIKTCRLPGRVHFVPFSNPLQSQSSQVHDQTVHFGPQQNGHFRPPQQNEHFQPPQQQQQQQNEHFQPQRQAVRPLYPVAVVQESPRPDLYYLPTQPPVQTPPPPQPEELQDLQYSQQQMQQLAQDIHRQPETIQAQLYYQLYNLHRDLLCQILQFLLSRFHPFQYQQTLYSHCQQQTSIHPFFRPQQQQHRFSTSYRSSHQSHTERH
jgi:hypothetical protein